MKRAHRDGLGGCLGSHLSFEAPLRNMREKAGTEMDVAPARGQGHRQANILEGFVGADCVFGEADERHKSESRSIHLPLIDCGEPWKAQRG